MRSRAFLLSILALPLVCGVALGQVQPSPAVALVPPPGVGGQRFTFRSYLAGVGRGNLDLIAERTTVSIAEAQVAVARIFPDPQLTAGILQYELTRQGSPTATIAALSVPLQIGGQRGARVAFAEANLWTTRADVDEFLRGLRASAATAYVDALHARLILERRRQSLASLEKLVAANEERFRVGDIGEALVLQSRVEANQFRAQVLDAVGDVKTADLRLVELLGREASALMVRELELEGDLRTVSERRFDTSALVRRALAERPDLISARRRLTAAVRQTELARANRVVDIGVGASWQHNLPASGPPRLPSSDFLGATVTVPIPFSRMYQGELDAAHAARRQAEALSRGASIRVESEVRQAIARYESAAARVRLYTGGVLADSDHVLEKTLYNYQRGGSTLVEVLVAQRTDNDVHLSYYDALADAARSLIAVEQASGGWELDLQ